MKVLLMFHAPRAITHGAGAPLWRTILWIGLCLLVPPLWAEIAVPTYRGYERRMGRGNIERVEFSPAGRYLAAQQRGRICIYDMWDASLVRTLGREEDGIYRLVYSPIDGSIYSVGRDKTLRHWDTSSGRELARTTLEGIPYEIEINTSGTLLLIGETNPGRLRVWDAMSLQALETISEEYTASFVWGRDASFSISSRYILFRNHSSQLRIYDRVNHTFLNTTTPQTFSIQCSFLTTETLVLIRNKVYANDSTEIWKPTDGILDTAQSFGLDKLYSVYLPERQQILLTGWSDFFDARENRYKSYNLICLYDFPKTTPAKILRLPTLANLMQAECSRDGRYLYAFTQDGAVYTYDLDSGDLLRNQQYGDPYSGYYGITWSAWTHDGKRIVTLGPEGFLTVYNAASGNEEWRGSLSRPYPETHYRYHEFNDAALSPDDILVAGSSTGLLWRFNLRTLEAPTVQSFDDHAFDTVEFSSSGAQLAGTVVTYTRGDINTEKTTTNIYNPNDLDLIHQWNMGGQYLLFKDDNHLLLSGVYNSSLGLSLYDIDPSSGTIHRTASVSYPDYCAPVLSEDGARFYSANSQDFSCYDLIPREITRIFRLGFFYNDITPKAFSGEFHSMATIPNRDELLVGTYVMNDDGSYDYTMESMLWMLSPAGQPLRCYKANLYSGFAHSIAVSPDGKRAAAINRSGVTIFELDPVLAVTDWVQYE